LISIGALREQHVRIRADPANAARTYWRLAGGSASGRLDRWTPGRD